jgi:hypothetical protein
LAQWALQALTDVEAAEKIGAGRYERTDDRLTGAKAAPYTHDVQISLQWVQSRPNTQPELAMSEVVAGWYRDPIDPGMNRYWSGSAWTDHTYPAAHPTPRDIGPEAHPHYRDTVPNESSPVVVGTAPPRRKSIYKVLGLLALIALSVGSIYLFRRTTRDDDPANVSAIRDTAVHDPARLVSISDQRLPIPATARPIDGFCGRAVECLNFTLSHGSGLGLVAWYSGRLPVGKDLPSGWKYCHHRQWDAIESDDVVDLIWVREDSAGVYETINLTAYWENGAGAVQIVRFADTSSC